MRFLRFLCKWRGYHQTWLVPTGFCEGHRQIAGHAGCCHVCGTQYDGHYYIAEIRFDLNKPEPQEKFPTYYVGSNELTH